MGKTINKARFFSFIISYLITPESSQNAQIAPQYPFLASEHRATLVQQTVLETVFVQKRHPWFRGYDYWIGWRCWVMTR